MKQVLRDPHYKEIVKTKIGQIIQRELKVLASKKENCMQRNKSKDSLLSFSWASLWSELSLKTPTLLNILETVVSRKTVALSKIQPVVCTVIAILAKFMNPSMNVIQSYISILLHAGHCSKQVGLSIAF